MIDINVNGVFHTVRAALPALIEAKGYILVVSSLAAFSLKKTTSRPPTR